MFTNQQAKVIIDVAHGHSPHAFQQALAWAYLVARANARHPFSDWSLQETEAVRETVGSDLVAALGHQTPARYFNAT